MNDKEELKQIGRIREMLKFVEIIGCIGGTRQNPAYHSI